MNINTFCTPDQIIADVLKLVDDERYELNTKGFYISQIQQALEEMSFDSFFDERPMSLAFPTDTLSMEVPKGVFNINQMYLFNGTECSISDSQNVWHKRNFFTRGDGYFARNKGNNRDPFYDNNSGLERRASGSENRLRYSTPAESQYYYNIQNGMIMFSSACAVFEAVHIVFNGTGCDIGEIPIIPLFFRQYVKDYVSDVALQIRMAKDKSGAWNTLWKINDNRLNEDYDGSRAKARYRVSVMENKEKEDLKEYLSRGAW